MELGVRGERGGGRGGAEMHRMYCLTSYLVVAVLFTLHLLSPALLILLCCSDDYGGAYDHGK